MPEVITKKDEPLKIFGDVDHNKDGKLRSTYPAYYFDQHIEELKESIQQKKSALELDVVPPESKGEFKEMLRQEENKLRQIDESRPRLTDSERDMINKLVHEKKGTLSLKIADSLFTNSQMVKGVADAHEEARRMSEPCIRLDPEEISFIKACEISITNDGKISRNAASKAWKIGRRLLGDISNVEILRKG